jgi:hypothetical protein
MLDCVASQAPSARLRVIYSSLSLVFSNYLRRGLRTFMSPCRSINASSSAPRSCLAAIDILVVLSNSTRGLI